MICEHCGLTVNVTSLHHCKKMGTLDPEKDIFIINTNSRVDEAMREYNEDATDEDETGIIS